MDSLEKEKPGRNSTNLNGLLSFLSFFGSFLSVVAEAKRLWHHFDTLFLLGAIFNVLSLRLVSACNKTTFSSCARFRTHLGKGKFWSGGAPNRGPPTAFSVGSEEKSGTILTLSYFHKRIFSFSPWGWHARAKRPLSLLVRGFELILEKRSFGQEELQIEILRLLFQGAMKLKNSAAILTLSYFYDWN